MSGRVTIIDEEVSQDVSCSSFVFDVIWHLLKGSEKLEPFRSDEEYLSALSWRERSYDCFLDLRKSRRPTLEAVRGLMIEHAQSTHPHWKDYYRKYLPEEGEEQLQLWQSWAQEAMLKTAQAIDRRLEIEDAAFAAAAQTPQS